MFEPRELKKAMNELKECVVAFVRGSTQSRLGDTDVVVLSIELLEGLARRVKELGGDAEKTIRSQKTLARYAIESVMVHYFQETGRVIQIDPKKEAAEILDYLVQATGA